ncbi:hypothetical protein EDF81_3905 [Enterobacter sp. BIGb0383]|uniref:helix-turn-helix domain-containing protein n=1 Tax=unclassified Enterobacter TaxID=2608935 RepID=UPI000F493EEE|nr:MULTISPECIES: helix-turn-helix domain-containing protein [unclassified Enterobacter]ROP56350.1 hypothetical protein EDF81_3905 [Enterobacter sp. BIGb0383]ROS04416.1 hypothetical protein EC848_4046 [Enterobacter sp. BIGb0359]
MTTTTQKRNVHDRAFDNRFSMMSADRLQNIVGEIAENIRAGRTSVSSESMSQTDMLFAFDLLVQYSTEHAIQSQTKEKKRLQRRLKSKIMFAQTLEADGGVLSTAETAEALGKTKTTVNTWRKNGRLLALDLDGEFYYPIFQFTDDEKISDEGVLKGLKALLSHLDKFSDRMQYSFFMEERNTVLDGFNPKGNTYTVADVLKSNPDPVVMEELHRLGRLFGSQDPA